MGPAKVVALILAAGFMSTASAEGVLMLFNNLGPGNTYTYLNAWAIGSTQSSSLTAIAQSFTSPVDATLDTILLGLSQDRGSTDGVLISLRTDSGFNSPGGTVLESFSAFDLPMYGSPAAPLMEASVLHPTLSAGDTYWIEVAPNSAATAADWNFNSEGDLGALWSTGVGTQLQTLGAMQVTADPVNDPPSDVPEPSTWALLAAALLAITVRGAASASARPRPSR